MTVEFKLSDEDFEKIRLIIRDEIGRALFEKEPKYYSIDQVCSILKISKPTFHNWVKQGKIVPKKIGNRVLIEETQIIIK